MKKTKKLIAFMTISIIIGSKISTIAEIPKGTAIIGKNAYSLEYLNNKNNKKEVIKILQTNHKDILIKTFQGKWINNFTKKEVKLRDIPKVLYKDKEGKITEYSISDGEEVKFGVEQVSFTKNNELKIKFSSYVDKEDGIDKGKFKINKKDLGKKDSVTISEDKKEITIKLNDVEKTKSFEIELQISKIKGIIEGNEIKNYSSKIMVVRNAQEIPKGEYDGDVSILANNVISDQLKVNGNVYIGGNGNKLTRAQLKGKIIVLPNSGGELEIKQSEYEGIYFLKGCKIGSARLEDPSLILSEDNKCFKELIISGNNKELNLLGEFSKVTIDSYKDINIGSHSNIDLLVANKSIKVEADSSVKVMALQKASGVKIYNNGKEDLADLPKATEIKNPTIVWSGGVGGRSESHTTKPVATNVTIKGIPQIGKQLIGKYLYNNADGAEEGKSIYTWYRADDAVGTNLEVIKGENYDRYLMEAQDIGKYIFLEVTPVSIDGIQGDPVRSTSSGIVLEKILEKVNVEVEGYNVKIILKGDNLKKDPSVKIINKETKALEYVDHGNSVNNSLEVNVRIEKVGEYILSYSAFNGEQNGTHEFTIVGEGAEDTIKPVIKLMGGDISLDIGEEFKEPGYVATDNRDGDITSKVEKTIKNNQGNVVDVIDTTKIGQYNIYYNLRDLIGNKAIEQLRKVIIKEKGTQSDHRVNIVVDNNVAYLTVNGENMNSVVVWKVVNKATGTAAHVGQKESYNNTFTDKTIVLSPGAYIIEIEAFQEGIIYQEFQV